MAHLKNNATARRSVVVERKLCLIDLIWQNFTTLAQL